MELNIDFSAGFTPNIEEVKLGENPQQKWIYAVQIFYSAA